MIALGLFLIGLGTVVYFVPAIIAYNRNHVNRMPILLLNFFLGWTLIGWVAALVWSATAQDHADIALSDTRRTGYDDGMGQVKHQLDARDKA